MTTSPNSTGRHLGTGGKSSPNLFFVFLLIVSAVVALIIFVGNKQVKENSNAIVLQQTNLVVLWDLSDRVTKPECRDTKLLEGIGGVFESLAAKPRVVEGRGSSNLTGYSADRLKIIVAPQFSTDVPIQEGAEWDLGALGSPLQKADYLDSAHFEIPAAIERIYRNAFSRNVFMGADIWRFIEEQLADHKVPPRDSTVTCSYQVRNVLLVITDGYIQFNREALRSRTRRQNRMTWIPDMRDIEGVNWRSSDWMERLNQQDYGLLVKEHAVDLSGWDVMVLEMQPKNPHSELTEPEYLRYWWKKWLGEHRVRSTEFVFITENLQDVVARLRRFLGLESGARTATGANAGPMPSTAVASVVPVAPTATENRSGMDRMESVTVSPLRMSAEILSRADVAALIRSRGYYCAPLNQASDWANPVRTRDGLDILLADDVFMDRSTGLMWDRRGSRSAGSHDDMNSHIANLNSIRLGGHREWRAPSLDEAMSLMTGPNYLGFFTDPRLKNLNHSVWTADIESTALAWAVRFDLGICVPSMKNGLSYYAHGVRNAS